MEFRTIEQRKRQVFSEPQNTQALVGDGGVRNQGIIGDQVRQNLGALAQQQAQNNAFRTQNLQTVQAAELANAQAKFNAMATVSEIETANARLYGAQALANQQRANQWLAQTERLQAIQEAEAANFEIQQEANTASAITGFGESLVNFSKSLWERKAQEVNEANQKAASRAILDTMLGRNPKVDASTFETLDQLKTADLIKAAQGESIASQLERDGFIADANEIRSRNPYYLYQVGEMQTMQAAADLPGFIEEARKILTDKFKGEPNADVEVEKGLRDAVQQYIIDRGLTELPPDMVARYLGKSFIENISNNVQQFRRENREYLKESRQRIALAEAVTSIPIWAGDEDEFKRVIANIDTYGGDNKEKLLANLAEAAYQYGVDNNDFTAFDQLMSDPLTKLMAPMLETWGMDKKRTYNEQQARKLEQYSKDQADELIGEFSLRLRELNPGDFAGEARLKAEYEDRAKLLNPEDYARVVGVLDGTNATSGDGAIVKRRMDEIVRQAENPFDAYRDLMNEAGQQTDPSVALAMRTEAEKYAPFTTNPAIKAAYDSAQAQIDALIGDVNPQVGIATSQPGFMDEVKAALRWRKIQFNLRTMDFFRKQDGAKDVNSYLEWIEKNNKDLLNQDGKSPLVKNNQVVDRARMTAQAPAVGQTTGVKMRRAPNGTIGPVLVGPEDRRKILEGRYGKINSNTTRVFTPNEIQIAQQHYLTTGEHQRITRALAAKAGVSPNQFLENQAELWGGTGTVGPRPKVKPSPAYTQPVSVDWVRSQAESQGLSPKGAVWLATQAQQESSFNPNAVGDSGSAFGMFQMRMDRQQALRDTAKRMGLPPNDARAQLAHAIDEIKRGYPSIWKVITAPNPTNKQLVDAQWKWLRFREDLKPKRAQSLLFNLQNMD